jgi:hypothetical protein
MREVAWPTERFPRTSPHLSRGTAVSAACRDITGNDRLAAVALGWRWRPARWRVGHALGQLDHLLRREVRSYRLLPTATGQIRMTADDDERTRRLEEDGSEDTGKLADAAWRRATVLDVVTGEISAVAGITGIDVVTVEGNPDGPFVEMVSAASIGSGRSRIRYWRTPPEAVPVVTTTPPSGSAAPAPPSGSPAPPVGGDYDERPVFGPTWIGDWRGPAWSSALLYVRACSPATLRLPTRVGSGWAAIGALQPNGRYAGTLVSVDSTQLDALGFLRANELLVAAMSSGATALLGWTPTGGEFVVVATFTDAVRLSVADLLLPS